MAQAFTDEFGLSRLHVIPAGSPYHRATQCGATAEQRLEMVKLGLASLPNAIADDREIRRHGNSYTIDTLQELRAEIGANTPLWLLLGGDAFASMQNWKQWQDIFLLCHIAVAMRPGFSTDALPMPVQQEWLTRQGTKQPIMACSGTIRPLALQPLDISASAVRTALMQKRTFEHLVPPAIASYIFNHGLYDVPATSTPNRP